MTLADVLLKSYTSILTDDELWEVRFALQERLRQLEKDMKFCTDNGLTDGLQGLQHRYETSRVAFEKIELLLH